MDFKDLAVQLGITLQYIPAGGTDQFHPLDRLIFRALKSATRRLLLQWIRDQPPDKVNKPEAVHMFIWS
jgi:hypothetical protein